MTKTEKERRNQIKTAIKDKERKALLEALPISLEMLQNCFDFLDGILAENNCDDTLKFTLDFIEQNNLPKDGLINWLENSGGYCDCEVLANVEGEINNE